MYTVLVQEKLFGLLSHLHHDCKGQICLFCFRTLSLSFSSFFSLFYIHLFHIFSYLLSSLLFAELISLFYILYSFYTLNCFYAIFIFYLHFPPFLSCNLFLHHSLPSGVFYILLTGWNVAMYM